MDKLCLLGLGYIGLPTAAMFANSGVDVVGVDTNQSVIHSLKSLHVHIEEIGLNDLVEAAVNKGRLTFSSTPVVADAFIVAVPTPIHADKTADLDYVESAVRSIIPVLRAGCLVIVESTIPPRTIDDIVAPIIREAGWNVGKDIFLAHCPERVLPGRILKEVVENTRIIGGINERSAVKAEELYRRFVVGDIIKTSALTAEMTKLMENTYRDVNIALANELVSVCDHLSINALEVIDLANRHPRVNIHSPGPGVGGHCLAVDPYFIVEKAPVQATLIQNSRNINNAMPEYVVSKVNALVNGKSAKIAVLGLSYKGNIDDIRESPAIEVVNRLMIEGYSVSIHDPHLRQENVRYKLESFEDAVYEADCVLILTDHNEFRNMDETYLLGNTRSPVVFDTRNCVSIKSSDIHYYNFGNLPQLHSLQPLQV